MSQIIKTLVSGGPIPPAIPLQFTTDSGIAIPTVNNLNVFGGTGATTSGSGSTITITVKNDGFTWSEKVADFSADIENGYFCNDALTATLPSVSLVIGNTIIFYVDTANPVVIQANAGQFIQIGSNISTIAGTATSNTRGSILELVFKPSDSTWHTISGPGSWSLSA